MHKGLEKRIHDTMIRMPLLQRPEIPKGVHDEFCKIFVESVRGILESLGNNPVGSANIQKLAHQLKGAAGFAGALRLSEIAAELELISPGISPDELGYFRRILVQVFRETVAAIKKQV